jgi:hypothetical protein
MSYESRSEFYPTLLDDVDEDVELPFVWFLTKW